MSQVGQDAEATAKGFAKENNAEKSSIKREPRKEQKKNTLRKKTAKLGSEEKAAQTTTLEGELVEEGVVIND